MFHQDPLVEPRVEYFYDSLEYQSNKIQKRHTLFYIACFSIIDIFIYISIPSTIRICFFFKVLLCSHCSSFIHKIYFLLFINYNIMFYEGSVIFIYVKYH